ncbi:MAG TPA: electron transport complex subunit RsxC [Candidatus Deferrimicrobiaceae bacterium]|nr:electron transport complex subunit RsxC [Candidatus Deferrimicrobiaceae bacterium]
MANLVEIKEKKDIARKTPIEVFPDPKVAVVLVNQQSGASNKALVSVGDSVSIGQKIADSTERVSAPVHSPISGKVTKIEKVYNSCFSDYTEAIFIEGDGKKTKAKEITPITEAQLKDTPNETLIKIIREAGIVGMGGAGFPTSIKLSLPKDKPIKTLIVNGAEGEPYDTADERLMIEKTENLVRGVRVIRKLLGNPKLIVVTKESKIEAIPKLQAAFGKEPDTQVVAKHLTYQQGDAAMLQKAILGYEANPDKRSYEMGTIVQNVATINAIANAVFEGEPLISRVTTLNGDDIKQPKNLLVKIGTPVSDILNANGIKNAGQVVVGGVMMGNALQSLDAPLTKRTSSIIIFSKTKAKVKKSTACIRCARCISACPARLQPSLLYEAINKGNFEKAEKLWAKDCIACGSCSYVCPAGLPLTSTIRSIKG